MRALPTSSVRSTAKSLWQFMRLLLCRRSMCFTRCTGTRGRARTTGCAGICFSSAPKDAAAHSVTVLTPYLCYARKDRKTKPRDPITTRYVAGLFEAVGADRVVTLDVHNLAAFQNAFRCATERLETAAIFADHFPNLAPGRE